MVFMFSVHQFFTELLYINDSLIGFTGSAVYNNGYNVEGYKESCISRRLMLSIMCRPAMNVSTDKQAERPELLGS
jgi:hypothetical protein